ncbi:MAG: DUF6431 domain-containing protein, partial [Clostridia bacterium]|nr:DUF6431 domain-containing protein [Clostridia bacterium]
NWHLGMKKLKYPFTYIYIFMDAPVCVIIGSVQLKNETGSVPCESRSCLCSSHIPGNPRPVTFVMITVFTNECNDFSQEKYNAMVNALPLDEIECTCGCTGCLIKYGHYTRKVRYRGALFVLVIQRVYCKHCHKTHAIMFSEIVPYSQIPLADQQDILRCAAKGQSAAPVLDRNLLLFDNDVKHVIHQYKENWERRLLSIGKTLEDKLIAPCLNAFSMQFMQVRQTLNQLYAVNNIG